MPRKHLRQACLKNTCGRHASKIFAAGMPQKNLKGTRNMYRRRQQFEMLMVLFRRPLPLNCLLFTMDGNSRWTCAIHSRNLFSGWHFAPDLCHPFTQLIFRMAFPLRFMPSAENYKLMMVNGLLINAAPPCSVALLINPNASHEEGTPRMRDAGCFIPVSSFPLSGFF
jgi:hypothetical protein